MGLRLRLLREFALEDAGTRIDVPVGTQRLIAFLALRGPSHRCFVAGMLWPEVPESQALASLRTGVWRVNRARTGCLVADGAQLGLPDEVAVDTHEHEDFTSRLLREHVEDEDWIAENWDVLWRGELLPGWYDDWVVFERERLHQLRLHALEYLAALMTRRGDLPAALHLALEAVRAEPLRESANARLIDVYLAEGNVYDALRQYDAFRALLQRELGLEPSPQLSGLLPAVPAR
jgi:DNA-binding SARP family transcriptional activator